MVDMNASARCPVGLPHSHTKAVLPLGPLWQQGSTACRQWSSDARFGKHLLAALVRLTPLLDSAHARLGVRPSCEHGWLRTSQCKRRNEQGRRQGLLDRPFLHTLHGTGSAGVSGELAFATEGRASAGS